MSSSPGSILEPPYTDTDRIMSPELIPCNHNTVADYGARELELKEALEAHSWDTKLELKFGLMRWPTMHIDGHNFEAQTRRPEGGTSDTSCIKFFEEYMRKAEACGAVAFHLYANR